MATYRDAAIAAYDARHAERITVAKERLRPLMTDKAGIKVLDPIGKTTVVYEDDDAGLIILQTTDGSDVSFAVWPEQPTKPVRVVQLQDGAWTYGPEALDLDDVGAALIELEATP